MKPLLALVAALSLAANAFLLVSHRNDGRRTAAVLEQAKAEVDAARRQVATLESRLVPATAPPAPQPPAPLPAQAQPPKAGSLPGASGSDAPAAPAPATTEAAPPEPGPKDGKGFLRSISGMMKNPAMKSLIRAQHRSLASSLYKDLARDLNLPPEQAEALYDAVADRLGTLSEAGLEAITDGTFDSARASASTRAAQETSDASLRELLGETGLQRFKSYEKTTGERVVLNQLANQLNGTSNQLAEHQRQGLLEIMIAERAQAPPLPNAPGNPVDFSEKAMSQVLAAQQSFQQRVHARALGILNPGQLQALDAFFEQQIAAQKVGMEMMRGSQ